jgi:RND family efflux transporter MFP subunit
MTQLAKHSPTLVVVRNVALGAVFTLVVVWLLLWLAGVFEAKVSPALRAVPLRLAGNQALVAVRAIAVPAVESAVGTIRAVQETAIAAEVLAKVVEVKVKAGDRVSEGDVLVRLDDEDLKARLRQAAASVAAARAEHDQAQTEFDRVRSLYEQNNAAKIEFQRAETELKASEAKLEQAQQVQRAAAKVLTYATIVSPFDGVVIDKRVEVGDTVAPEKVLLTLYDPTRMQLVASVRDSLVQRLQKDQVLPVHIDALGRTCRGVVTEIVPQSDVASRTFLVKVSGPCPPDIHSGMFGRLLIPLDDEMWLVIPQAAVRRVGQLDIVDVADPSGKYLERRVVQLGRTRGDEVEVLSGLRVGEKVAVPPGTTSRQVAP